MGVNTGTENGILVQNIVSLKDAPMTNHVEDVNSMKLFLYILNFYDFFRSNFRPLSQMVKVTLNLGSLYKSNK